MITITIDGKEIQTDPAKTIIEAAFENGMYVPHFCWHPALSVSGNCRMCLVEVEKMPKQVIACSTRCMDGMVVHVNSDKAVQAREAVMEFVLINHPLDCPICDEAGECKLQDYAYRYSVGESRFDEEKQHQRKRSELGPNVVFDGERCIACSRCIRFCEDIAGYPQLTFVERGDSLTIETFPGKKLDNPYSMNVVDICPVGALTSKQFRFQSRVWDMSSTPSVCTGCSRGCSIDVWVRQNEILRLTPRENQEVNDFWMCDRGRLESWKDVGSDTRVRKPMIRRNEEMLEVDWDEALAATASELKGFKGGEIAFIGSPFDSCEDNFVLSRFAGELFNSSGVDILPHLEEGDEDEFLIRADKTPNSTGAFLAGVRKTDMDHGADAVLDKIRGGGIKAVVVTDYRAAEHPDFIAALSGVRYVIAIVSNHSALTGRADVLLPSSTFAEKLGTFVNFQNQMQLIKPAVVTEGNERWMGGYAMSRLDKFGSEFDRWGRIERVSARPTWQILNSLAGILGAKWNYAHPEDVFDAMKSSVEILQDLSYEKLGRWGVRLGVRLDAEQPSHVLPYKYSEIR